MKRFLCLPSLVLLSAFLGGCYHSPSNLPEVSMQIGTRTFKLEIANTDDSRETGLMQRDSMPDDHGMIFVFSDEHERPFWMKNTRFPLDIIFINSAGVIVSIKQMKPYDQTVTPSDGPVRYAIELNKDAAASAGLKVGDHLNIPPEAKSK